MGLIQHADFNLDLQRRGLAMMQAAVEADDADPSDLAYLVDRVLVAEGKPQVYGTAAGCRRGWRDRPAPADRR